MSDRWHMSSDAMSKKHADFNLLHSSMRILRFLKNVAHKYLTFLFGILRNPDRTRTWTRTRRKPGLGKNPDSCSDSRLRNPDSTIENPDSKSKILDSMKLDSDNIRNPEYIPIFNCLSEIYNRNSQILR